MKYQWQACICLITCTYLQKKKKKKSHLFWRMISTLLENRPDHNLRMLAMSGVGIMKKWKIQVAFLLSSLYQSVWVWLLDVDCVRGLRELVKIFLIPFPFKFLSVIGGLQYLFTCSGSCLLSHHDAEYNAPVLSASEATLKKGGRWKQRHNDLLTFVSES